MCTEEDQYFASSSLRGTEAIVAGLCKVALDRQSLRVDDNLFTEGMTKPQIVELVLSINRTFDTRVSDVTIFEHPTVRAIASWLQNAGNTSTETSLDLRTQKS
jgi:hypothetical protein